MTKEKTAAGSGPGLEGFLRLIAQAIARKIIEGRDGASLLQEPGKGAPNTPSLILEQGKGKEGAAGGSDEPRPPPAVRASPAEDV